MESKFDKTEIEKILNISITTIKEITHGYDQFIFVLTATDEKKYVLKIPKKEPSIIQRELEGNTICEKYAIPHAKILYADSEKYIQEFSGDMDLANGSFTKQEYETFYSQIGKWLACMHKQEENYFGKTHSDQKYATAIEYLTQYYDEFIETKEIDDELREKVKEYFTKTIHIVEHDKPVLIHDDLHEYNIRIDEDKITAIIDFGDAKASIKEQDYAMIYMDDELDLHKLHTAIKQDESISLEKIELCVVIRTLFFLDRITMSDEREELLLTKLQTILEK